HCQREQVTRGRLRQLHHLVRHDRRGGLFLRRRAGQRDGRAAPPGRSAAGSDDEEVPRVSQRSTNRGATLRVLHVGVAGDGVKGDALLAWVDPRVYKGRTVTRAMVKSIFALAIVLVVAVPASAQWLRLPIPGTPRTPDGKPNLAAPAPKTPDGKPDFSGIWVVA